MHMHDEIQRADLRLRRTTAIVLVIAALLAALLVFAFGRWLSEFAAAVPTEHLVLRLRPWIGIAAIASSLCLFVLAGLAATRARRATVERRWPVRGARVLRDTVVRNGDAALRIARLLNLVALVLVAIGAAAILLGWRLFAV
jgi:hypothetical protein